MLKLDRASESSPPEVLESLTVIFPRHRWASTITSGNSSRMARTASSPQEMSSSGGIFSTSPSSTWAASSHLSSGKENGAGSP